MTLPLTGPITLDMVADLLGRPPGSYITLDDPEVRAIAGVAPGEVITIDDLRGKGLESNYKIIPEPFLPGFGEPGYWDPSANSNNAGEDPEDFIYIGDIEPYTAGDYKAEESDEFCAGYYFRDRRILNVYLETNLIYLAFGDTVTDGILSRVEIYELDAPLFEDQTLVHGWDMHNGLFPAPGCKDCLGTAYRTVDPESPTTIGCVKELSSTNVQAKPDAGGFVMDRFIPWRLRLIW